MTQTAETADRRANPWAATVAAAAADLNAVADRRRWWNYPFHLGHEEGRRYRYALLFAAFWELDNPPETTQE